MCNVGWPAWSACSHVDFAPEILLGVDRVEIVLAQRIPGKFRVAPRLFRIQGDSNEGTRHGRIVQLVFGIGPVWSLHVTSIHVTSAHVYSLQIVT